MWGRYEDAVLIAQEHALLEFRATGSIGIQKLSRAIGDQQRV